MHHLPLVKKNATVHFIVCLFVYFFMQLPDAEVQKMAEDLLKQQDQNKEATESQSVDLMILKDILKAIQHQGRKDKLIV